MMKKDGIFLRLRMFVMVNINDIRIITLVLFYEQDLRNKILSRKFCRILCFMFYIFSNKYIYINIYFYTFICKRI